MFDPSKVKFVSFEHHFGKKCKLLRKPTFIREHFEKLFNIISKNFQFFYEKIIKSIVTLA